ncbi:MAG: ankyrin repeat domain-containing protein [Mediterranea sp.]|jgi:ankyrin repeat protein|nr:ankyrin repeat domain-containing protein [Mediterranea sp.]
MMDKILDIDECLKDAIACNDIEFLEKNKDMYDIDHRFKDEDNDSLLLYSISDKESYAYKFLIERGANIALTNELGEGIMHAIVFSGDVERLEYIVKIFPHSIAMINDRSNDGTTPLLLATLLGKDEIFQALIDMNADISLPDNENNAPIHMACWDGNINMVKRLVDSGVNLHVKTERGNYPLALAVNGDHDDIVKYLYGIIYGMPDNTEGAP